MKGNVCYQKTDFGSESPYWLDKYVLKVTKIAGINLKNDITAEQLKVALNVPTLVSQLVNDSKYVNESDLQKEVNAREVTDEIVKLIQEALATEQEKRAESDKALSEQVQNEENIRQTSDNLIQECIDKEIEERIKAIQEHNTLIQALQSIAHVHDNKSVIDGITEESIELWNTVKDFDNQFDLDNYKAYVDDVFFGFVNQFQDLYASVGVTLYDGGINEQPQFEVALDGGAFDDEDVGFVDCGCWDIVVSVIDGGGYADVTGNIIDGGGYADTVGNVLDGGNYPN